jgi:hypothetical protein
MFRLLALSAALLTAPVMAQTDPIEVEGRWRTSDSDAQFRAVLSPYAEALRLQIFPVEPEGRPEAALLDNPAITGRPTLPGARAWLDVSENGTLLVHTVVVNDGYTYSDRLTLGLVDRQITVIRAEMFNIYPVNGQPVTEPFQCGQGCYSCDADLIAGTALAGGEAITLTPPPAKALDAALWTADSVYALGFCPAPN